MWILEYFVVYVLCISSAGYVELPVLLYLLQCLVYHTSRIAVQNEVLEIYIG